MIWSKNEVWWVHGVPRGLGASGDKMMLYSFCLELKIIQIPQTTIFCKKFCSENVCSDNFARKLLLVQNDLKRSWLKWLIRQIWMPGKCSGLCSKIWKNFESWTDGPWIEAVRFEGAKCCFKVRYKVDLNARHECMDGSSLVSHIHCRLVTPSK